MKQRKFYVFYLVNNDYYKATTICLLEDEKANVITFNEKLKQLGGLHKEVVSWSLIE
jgi:hypothetical protein